MSALFTSQQGFAVLRRRLRHAGRLPGQDNRFAADELEPVSAQADDNEANPSTAGEREGAKQERVARMAEREPSENQVGWAKTQH